MPRRNNHKQPLKGQVIITEVADYGTHSSVMIPGKDPLANDGMTPIGDDPLEEEEKEEEALSPVL